MSDKKNENKNSPLRQSLIVEEQEIFNPMERYLSNNVSPEEKTNIPIEEELDEELDEECNIWPEPTNTTSDYVVCEGAYCRCIGSPIPVLLKVETNNKVYVNDNGSNKLAAVVSDRATQSNFVICSLKKSNDKSCSFSQAMEDWKIPNSDNFPDVLGKKVLTAKGTLNCPFENGTISILTHGQSESVDATEVKETLIDVSTINTLIDYDKKDLQNEEFLDEYVNDVQKIEYIDNPDIRIAPIKGMVRAFNILVNERTTFKASVKIDTRKNNKERRGYNISWGVTQELVEDALKGGLNKVDKKLKLENDEPSKVDYKETKTTSEEFSVTFTKLGVYIVDASSRNKINNSWNYYKNQYYYFKVVDKISIEFVNFEKATGYYIHEPIKLQVQTNLPLLDDEVEKFCLEVYRLESSESNLVQEKLLSAIDFQKTFNKNEVNFSFKIVDEAKYRYKLYFNNALTDYVGEFTVLENKIKDIVIIGNNADKQRPNKDLIFEAKLEKENCDPSKIEWEIYQGGSQSGKKVEKKDKIISKDFTHMDTYRIVARYGNGFFGLGKEKIAERTIEIVKNSISSIDINGNNNANFSTTFSVFQNNDIKLNIKTLLEYEYSCQVSNPWHVVSKKPVLSVYDKPEKFSYNKKIECFYIEDEALNHLEKHKGTADPLFLFMVKFSPEDKQKKTGCIIISYNEKVEEKVKVADTVYFTSSLPSLNLNFMVCGQYCISVGLGNDDWEKDFEVKCKKGNITKWEFQDANGIQIFNIGYKQDFYIKISIEGAANQKANLHLWVDGGKEHSKDRFLKLSSDEISFDDKGHFLCEVSSSSKIWEILKNKLPGWASYHSIFFTLSNLSIELNNNNQKTANDERLKDHIFTNETVGSYAKLGKKRIINGYFADERGEKLETIVEYGVKVPVCLNIFKGLGEAEDNILYEIHIYENLKDEDRFVEAFTFVSKKGSFKNIIELETHFLHYGSGSHERDIGNIKNPRLFYFILYRVKNVDESNYSKYESVKYDRIQKTNIKNLEFLYSFPENYTNPKKNDESLIKFYDEDEGRYIEKLIKEKEARENNIGNITETMGLALRDIVDKKSTLYKGNVESHTKKYEDNIKRINDIKKELETLNEYKKIQERNNKVLKSSGNNYFEQLKIAKHNDFNNIIGRKSPVKIESSVPQQIIEGHQRSDCPRCNAAVVAIDEEKKSEYEVGLNKIFTKVKVEDKEILEKVAKAYTENMAAFGMNTCWNKAYFFAQAIGEVDYNLNLSKGEGMNYTLETYDDKNYFFSLFCPQFFKGEYIKNKEEKIVWKSQVDNNATYKFDDGRVFKSEKEYNKFNEICNTTNHNREKEKLIANFVYGSRLGNNSKIAGEGWRFRGRGLCQVTGRTNYTEAYEHIKHRKEFEGLDINNIEDADKIVKILDDDAYLITLFSMGHWKNVMLHQFSNLEEEADEISIKIGNNVAWTKKKIAFNDKTSRLFKANKKDCTFTYFPDKGDGVLEMMKRYVIEGWEYSQEGSRIGLKYKDIYQVDCSEVVSLYLYHLGITPEQVELHTGVMTTEEDFRKVIKNNNIVHVENSKKEDFIPKRGDIFVWRKDGKGHTGIVYDYRKDDDIVIILESIGKYGSSDEKTHLTELGFKVDDIKNQIKSKKHVSKTRISYYKRTKKALFAHDGWFGYFRPINYNKKL